MKNDETLDNITPESGKTNFKKWAFKFLIYSVALNLILISKLLNHSGYGSSDKLVFLINSTSIIIDLLVLSGSILTILSISKNEKTDYKYWLNIIGYSLLILSFIYFNLF